ncbi:MBOAT family O-acyltransferase [Oscillospiraceae bacterium MB08-C2-2]|nr:MBOAT family O-acyltransferase [Oscillospiraceae bacterium MB08-C2-2]
MVFTNLIFLYLFLPANLILYFVTKNQTYRNVVLVAFSLFFYAWGEPIWILLLLFSGTVDYLHGLIIEHFRGTKWMIFGVISSLIINLGLLSTFKYSGFFISNINSLFGSNLPLPSFGLPLGISFYTFQSISYVVDVYRGKVKAQRNYLTFMLYISLYHRLVAGPIVRYTDVAHELGREVPTFASMSAGIPRFCVGLVKKILVANYAGNLVGQYLTGDLTTLSVAEGWFGILMFSIQLYFDFSGYSDMALGLGQMFNCHYYENFQYPYIARSASEFWRRWHISLGSFFRDYVYIPMGGNRKRLYLNLLVVWLLTGLWHGASWNYVLWGLYYGVLIMLERLFLGKLLDKLPRLFSHLYLIFVTLVGWTLFYFEDFARLRQMFSVLFNWAAHPLWDAQLGFLIMNNIFWIVLSLAFCTPILPYIRHRLEDGASLRRKTFITYAQSAACLVMLALSTAMLVGESYNPFLYFKF